MAFPGQQLVAVFLWEICLPDQFFSEDLFLPDLFVYESRKALVLTECMLFRKFSTSVTSIRFKRSISLPVLSSLILPPGTARAAVYFSLELCYSIDIIFLHILQGFLR